MFKSVQIKIVLIFMILGIFMLATQGIILGLEMQKISEKVVENEEIVQILQTHIKQAQIITIILRCV